MKVALALVLLALYAADTKALYVYARNRFGYYMRTVTPSHNHEATDVFRLRQFTSQSKVTNQNTPERHSHLGNFDFMEVTGMPVTRNPYAGSTHPSAASRLADLSYLDPTHFRARTVTLEELELIWAEIESHTGSKNKKKTVEYTGTRLLTQLLREQCSRMTPSEDDRINVFCAQSSARLSSIAS